MDSHYVCTGGCGGLSNTPGTCQAETCPKHDQPLTECHCEDTQHTEVMTQTEAGE